VTVRQLLAHEAGLPVIDEALNPRLIADFDRLADVIARQRPLWEPGSRHGYHGISIGWYMGELVRRIDPDRRTLGRFFADEIAGPLELDVHFGVPEEIPKRRIARIERAAIRSLPNLRDMPPRMALAMANPRSVTFKAFANPRLRTPASLDSRHYRHLEFPAGGALGTARGIARAYSAFAVSPPELGVTEATMDELTAAPRPPARGWHDEVLKVDTAFSHGFARPHGELDFGFSKRSFGHPGAGGSFAFADPDAHVSFAYVMNRMGFHIANDPREKSLRDAFQRCIARELRSAA
jgi:CubicO group peptidase (beta-lactamase class C family)